MTAEIRLANPDEADDLLPLMRGYCDFYEANPTDEGLRDMATSLASDSRQGVLFIARDGGEAVGFAAMGWKWSSLRGSRIGFLEDLFVAPESRGGGIAEALIAACGDACRERGMPALEWMTATDNHRAQKVYDRIGAEGEEWRVYELELGAG